MDTAKSQGERNREQKCPVVVGSHEVHEEKSLAKLPLSIDTHRAKRRTTKEKKGTSDEIKEVDDEREIDVNRRR